MENLRCEKAVEKKRDLPILLCKNDINDEKFETRLSTSHIVQQEVLFGGSFL